MSHIDKETLLDYTFELLDDAEAKTVSEHLESCDECRKGLEAIAGQFAQLDLIKEDTAEISADLMRSVQVMAEKKLVSQHADVGEDTSAVDRESGEPPALPGSPKPFPAWRVLLATAACLAIAAYVVFGPGASDPGRGPIDMVEGETGGQAGVGGTDQDGGKVEDGKGHVVDEGAARKGDESHGPAKGLAMLEQPYFEPGSNIELNVLPRRDDVQLTIYNAEDLTLVRERRKLTMKRGWNWLQYMWKNTLIDPTSLELKPIGVGDKVEVVQLVFPPRMTGVGRWLIKSEVSGQVECEITYFTSGIGWRAFYEGTLTADETKMELKPYVRIDNGSGEEYEDAQTRLVVGQVNLHEPIAVLAQRQHAYGTAMAVAFKDLLSVTLESAAEDEKAGVDAQVTNGVAISHYVDQKPKQVIKEGLSEYQLYTIEGKETIPNSWGKRLPASKPVMVPVTNLYKYDEDRWGNTVVRFLSFKNDKDHELGDAPLPEGAVRVYGTPPSTPDTRHSQLTYVGATTTKYVPLEEDVELNLGAAEKVLVEPKLMTTETKNFAFDRWGNVAGWDEIQNWTVKLTNSRPVQVELEITRNFASQHWTLTQQNAGVTYEKHDISHGRFTLTLKPGEKKDLTYELIRKHGTNQK